MVVEAITRVQSVDLVADPATTAGLFEQTATAVEVIDPAVALREEIAGLKQQLGEAVAQTERETRLRKLEQRLRASGVAAVSEAFLRELIAAPAEDVDGLIEREVNEARQLVESRKPRSREQTTLATAAASLDTAAFVEAITRRR